MDERHAIQLLKKGNITGLEHLVREYQLSAVKTAYLILRERSAAEDIVQSVFLRVYERINQFDEERPFAPWFYRILINEALKLVTREISPISLEADFDFKGSRLQELLADPAPDPETQAETAELRQKIWEALGQLPPQERAAVVMRYYLDFSEAEIARQTKSPLGTVKWRLHAARQRLHKLLQPKVSD